VRFPLLAGGDRGAGLVLPVFGPALSSFPCLLRGPFFSIVLFPLGKRSPFVERFADCLYARFSGRSHFGWLAGSISPFSTETQTAIYAGSHPRAPKQPFSIFFPRPIADGCFFSALVLISSLAFLNDVAMQHWGGPQAFWAKRLPRFSAS